MRARTALALVPLLGVALATTGHAAPTKVPQVKDPTGDAVTQQADNDIVSVLWTTTGKGSGRSYVPKQLAVTMTLAAPPSSLPAFTYEVEATHDTCGDVSFTMEQGSPYATTLGVNSWADWGTCSNSAGEDSTIELLAAKVKGSTITWSFSLKAIDVKVGSVFSDFRARVDPTNPVVPFPSSLTMTELGLVDSATGKGTWKVG